MPGPAVREYDAELRRRLGPGAGERAEWMNQKSSYWRTGPSRV